MNQTRLIETKRVRDPTVPDRLIIPLKWGFATQITDSDTFTDTIISGNSAFDPGVSLSSTQPSGFDYYATLYGHYRVLGSKIRVRVMPQFEVISAGFEVISVVYASNTNGTVGSWADAIVQPGAVTKRGTSYFPMPDLRNQMQTGKISGVASVEGADRLQALISANPADEWYWHITTQNLVTGTDKPLNLYIEVIYDVCFFDKSPLGNSTLLDRLKVVEENRKGMRYFTGYDPKKIRAESLRKLAEEKKSQEDKDLELLKQCAEEKKSDSPVIVPPPPTFSFKNKPKSLSLK